MTEHLSIEMNLDAELIAREVPSQRVLELAVCPPDADRSRPRPALNLALVIDRSGSMSGEKLACVKRAAAHVLDLLNEGDRVAVVAYDTTVSLLAPSAPVTASARAGLKASIEAMRSGNTTNLSGGWLEGCQQVADAIREGGVNRVLLLTDGLANVGITDLEELGLHAGQLLMRGVATSTFGVGEGFNEHLLEHMANQGGGSFYYIASPREITGIFEAEFRELLAVTARQVEVRLGIPAGVAAQVLGGWRTVQNEGELCIWLGELAAGQRREVYIKLLTPPSTAADALVLQANVSAQGEGSRALAAAAQVSLRYAPLAEAQAVPLQAGVMERFSQVDMADKMTEALRLERAGEREKASRLMDQTLFANAPYLSAPMAADYRDISQRMQDGLDEATIKERHSQAYTQKQRRQR